jgi:hypothetical protein
MCRFPWVAIVLVLLATTGCASTKNSVSSERRKELADEKFDWMRSTAMDKPNGFSTTRNPW